jgi:hypothetical protein
MLKFIRLYLVRKGCLPYLSRRFENSKAVDALAAGLLIGFAANDPFVIKLKVGNSRVSLNNRSHKLMVLGKHLIHVEGSSEAGCSNCSSIHTTSIAHNIYAVERGESRVLANDLLTLVGLSRRDGSEKFISVRFYWTRESEASLATAYGICLSPTTEDKVSVAGNAALHVSVFEVESILKLVVPEEVKHSIIGNSSLIDRGLLADVAELLATNIQCRKEPLSWYWHSDWLAISDDSTGDFLFVKTDPFDGFVYLYNHEEAFPGYDPSKKPTFASISDCVSTALREY